jgi:pimeloyl-ACP methyl ester carboxylesterase
MRSSQNITLALVFATALPAMAQAYDVARMGSFPIGGREVTLHDLPVREMPVAGANFSLKIDPNGDYQVDQMYVQYVKLVHATARYPLLLVHGGGMTASTWEDTPDGRPGWQTYFLQHGHDVYMIDTAGRGRAGFAPPQVWTQDPVFPNAAGTWDLARIGPPGSYTSDPSRRAGFPGSKFPIAFFDTLMKERVPSWAALNVRPTQDALSKLVDRVCPCVLIAHSSGGPLALRAAIDAPEKIKGVVVIEPAGAPDPAMVDATKLRSVPHLFLWGDFLTNDPVQARAIPPVKTWQQALAAVGASSEWIELPKIGISGNTHVMMMDTNSDQVADVVQDWMSRHAFMQ